jgi:hypothetical protein
LRPRALDPTVIANRDGLAISRRNRLRGAQKLALGEVGVAGEWRPGCFFFLAAGFGPFLTDGAGSGWDGATGAGGPGESQPTAIKGANKNISRHAARFISLSLQIREKPPADPDLARRIGQRR